MEFEELPQGFKDWKNQYACDDINSAGYKERDNRTRQMETGNTKITMKGQAILNTEISVPS